MKNVISPSPKKRKHNETLKTHYEVKVKKEKVGNEETKPKKKSGKGFNIRELDNKLGLGDDPDWKKENVATYFKMQESAIQFRKVWSSYENEFSLTSKQEGYADVIERASIKVLKCEEPFPCRYMNKEGLMKFPKIGDKTADNMSKMLDHNYEWTPPRYRHGMLFLTLQKR